MRRRELLFGSLLLPALPVLADTASKAAASGSATPGLVDSRLIYLTPLLRDGSESKCQAEVWYVLHDSSIYVNTQFGAWRAHAVRKGLTKARIWVGDVGPWLSSEGKYKDLPQIHATGSIVANSTEWDAVFPVFGEKYSDEWPAWGPRFKSGLEDGSRTLIKYSNIA